MSAMKWIGFITVYRHFSTAVLLRHSVSGTKLGKERDGCRDHNVPEKPKKPPNPFLRFVNAVRDELLRQYPNSSNKEIVKLAAIGWRRSSDSFKKPFYDAFEKDRERYSVMLNAYEACFTPEQKAVVYQMESNRSAVMKELRFAKKVKKLGKPKRPSNPYNLFLATKRGSKGPNESVAEWLKKIGYEWKNMPDIEKEKYSLRYQTILEQYFRDKYRWKTKMLEAGIKDIPRSRPRSRSAFESGRKGYAVIAKGKERNWKDEVKILEIGKFWVSVTE